MKNKEVKGTHCFSLIELVIAIGIMTVFSTATGQHLLFYKYYIKTQYRY